MGLLRVPALCGSGKTVTLADAVPVHLRRALCLSTIVVAALLCLRLAPVGAQTSDGPALLAAFKAWQRATAPAAEWSEALAAFRKKLIADGRTDAEANQAIDLIAAYDEGTYYDETYTKAPEFKTTPNQLLVESTRKLRPGRALDVGMGMGRNALHLARRGWDVTGFDVSAVGVRQARDQARRENLTLTTIVAADQEFAFGSSQWDLIAIIYAIEKRSIHRVRDALRPGGLVVVEAGINSDPKAFFGYAPGELRTIFQGFEILRHEEVEGTYDWGPERIRLVRFVARKPPR